MYIKEIKDNVLHANIDLGEDFDVDVQIETNDKYGTSNKVTVTSYNYKKRQFDYNGTLMMNHVSNKLTEYCENNNLHLWSY